MVVIHDFLNIQVEDEMDLGCQLFYEWPGLELVSNNALLRQKFKRIRDSPSRAVE